MLTLNLAKLSYTADLPPEHTTQQFEWKHRQNDLVAVFDTFRSGGTLSEFLRIVQASQVLYDIPLEEMIREGKQLTQTLARHGAGVKCDQLPVSGINKCPLLALRWSLRDLGKVRRIQMRFASTREYEAAMDHLRHLGLWMTSAQSNVPNAPKDLARPQSGGPSCPPSQLSEITTRPFTAAAATAPSLQIQLRDAVARPSSAKPLNPDPLTPPVYFPRPDSSSTVSTYDRFSELPTITESRPMSAARPDTAMLFARPSTSELPPRRELPFQRPDTPKSRGSESVRPGSRPSSSLMGPPPLPPSRAARQRPTSRAGSSPAAELPPLPKPTPLNNIHAGPQPKADPSRRILSRGTDGVFRPTSTVAIEQENQRLNSSPPPSRPVSSNGAAKNRPLSAISDSAQNERISEPLAVLPTPPTSDANYQNHVSSEDSNGPDVAMAELEVYAKQSNEVRMDALNSFILQHLEDDNFLALVDDMDACWARIAPGFG